MKKHILKVVIALFAFVAAAMSVMAETGTVTYISESKTVKIEAQTESANSLASVFVVPSSKVSDENTISPVSKEEIESGNYFYRAVKTDAKGKLTLDMDISDALGGKYQAFVFVGEEVITDDAFLHTNANEINTIIQEEINPADTYEKIADIIKEKSDTFGYDAEEILKVCNELGKIIYASRPSEGYPDNGAFETVYNKAMSIIEMKGAEKPSGYMETNGALFGMNAENYKELTQTVKDDFADRIKNADLLSGDIDTIVKNSLYLAILNSNSDYTSMKDDALSYADYADVELESILFKLNDYERGLLFKELFKTDYSSVSDFIAAVEDKAPDYEDLSGNSGGSNGGSSGGGFSVPSNIPVTPSPIVTPQKTYSDISSHWAKEIILKLSDKDIISGYTDNTFKPDNSITRAEFVKILVCMTGEKLTAKTVFEDVAADDWHYKYVATANDMGLIKGNDGKFNPNGLITRQDAAVMIYRYVEKVHGALSGEENFGDIDKASDYAVKSIKALAANKLISGSDGRFNPLNNTTRAEAAAFIYKLISFMEEA